MMELQVFNVQFAATCRNTRMRMFPSGSPGEMICHATLSIP